MDYIVWHQDLVTSAPVSDLEIFRVPDEGLFLAAATLDRHEPRRKQQSTLFKWNKDHFTVYQSLYTLGAFCWEHFVIGKRVNHIVLLHVIPYPRSTQPGHPFVGKQQAQ